jgi:hypothetical protein
MPAPARSVAYIRARLPAPATQLRSRAALKPALSGLIALIAVAATAMPAVAATPVSYSALLREVKSGPLIRAVINPARGDIEIKFRNLSEWEAFFPPGAQPTLQRLLHERHVRVIFASRRAAHVPKRTTVHHHLRYIAAGVLGALALIGGGALLYRRRPLAPLGSDASAG